MELDERKKIILKAVIRNYLETGEPVGSRTISKYTDLNLSSATIRNEMSDLEELGYIIQPHTSAGRIPSDKGYRFYVDTMLEEKEREVEVLKGILTEKDEKMDTLLKRVARTLATDTDYAAMVTAPHYHGNKLKFIQLSRVDVHQILTVIVVEGNVIKNTILNVDETLDDETLLKLNILLNTHLNGLSLDEINLGMIAAMKQQAGIHSAIVSDVIDAVAEAIRSDEELKIYTSGTNNILKYPELTDNREKARELINTLEEEQMLNELVQETLTDENSTGIQVYIGNETPVQSMKDCSVVTATYELGEGMRGTIGIIGPKRMDYDKVIGTLKKLMTELDTLYKSRKDGADVADERNVDELEQEITTDEEAVQAEADTQPEEAKEGVNEETEEGSEAEEDGKDKKGFFSKKKDKKEENYKAQIAELQDKVMRQMAEFENYRRRTDKEKTAMFETGARSVIEKVLPVVDNFERGLAMIPAEQMEDPIADGMNKIYRQLMTELENLGVKPIEAVGVAFNPDLHNAVMQVANDELESGTVAQELLKGYTYRDTVVRHSMVAVVE